MLPILQQHYAIQRRSKWERLISVVGVVCIGIFLFVNIILHRFVAWEEHGDGNIQIGSVYVSEPAQRNFYDRSHRGNKRDRDTAGIKSDLVAHLENYNHGHGHHRKRSKPHINRQKITGRSSSDNTDLLDRIEKLRVPEPHSPTSLPYDINDCPATPTHHYPFAWDAVQVLSHWNVDTTAIPSSFIHQSICRFAWGDERIDTYRKKEVPFIILGHPELQETVGRWNTPGYMQEMVGDEPQRNEHSANNHLMFWRMRKAWSADYTPPTENVELSFRDWTEKAEAIESMSDEEETRQDHFYFRLNAGKRSNEYLYDELPFFRPDPRGDFMVDPLEERGINCRFGMKGSIAEAHYDFSRNYLVVLKGQRRYILAHPAQCRALSLYPENHPSARHSSVNWGTEYNKLAGAQLTEVVLQPADAMYLPTNWFHFIVSLNTNYQCNARSGTTRENTKAITDCGFSVPE